MLGTWTGTWRERDRRGSALHEDVGAEARQAGDAEREVDLVGCEEKYWRCSSLSSWSQTSRSSCALGARSSSV